MDPSVAGTIAVTIVTALGSAIGAIYANLSKRARLSESRWNKALTESEERCRDDFKRLSDEMKELRDKTIKDNTIAFSEQKKSLDKILDRLSSSGAHLAVRDTKQDHA